MIQAGASGSEKADLVHLADYFCKASRLRIGEKFRGIRHNTDRAGYRVAQQVLAGNQKPSPPKP
jgi:hypothetical protein